MAKPKDEEYVTFLNAAGEEISNDPRWRARKVLEAAGENANDNSEALSAAEQRIAELEAQLAAAQAAPPQGVEDLEDDGNEDKSTAVEDKYTTMGGDELKNLAKERSISIKGLTKVGQVRDALRAADAAE